MSIVPGLSPNIRLDQEDPTDATIMVEDGSDTPEISNDNAILKIDHDDGSITISLDGKPIKEDRAKGQGGWFENLVEDIDEMELHRVSDELLRGIKNDIQSRQEWIEDRALGIKLLGFKIEIPGTQGASDGAPVDGMSKVRHPLLQEAVLRFQANARSELLPTDGPVKVRNDNNNADLIEDQLANALEKDLNHYLTTTASEYYPDTDRMLLMLGFGGTAFKKIYYCPIRNRPVSETVDADDLIVDNSATDLRNAKRVTHRSFMRPSTVKRLQILGVYKDIDLADALMANLDAVQLEKNAQQGITNDSMAPADRDREIYECYCELDLKGYEHQHKGKDSGLEIPYRVTIDVSSKQILSIVRNYNEDDKELPESRANFVKYTFVPGMGFYDIGLLHILGNTTNALTAAWREMLDAGMYANFPGFLMADTGARQNTNIFRVPPGGGALVKTGGVPISQAIMPLPYKDVGQGLMALTQAIELTGQRIGGTSENQVGEGRADAPVGTTLAMIEQAQKVLNAVHKRMHAAQAEEFRLLVECFKEHPDSFWQRNRKPTMEWDEATFMKALNDCELTPQADPNTASHGQRVMKIMALKQLQQANPSMYDPIAIDTAALQAIGWSNPQQFLAPPEAQGKMPPEMLQAQAKMAADKTDSDAKMLTAQTKQAEVQAKIQSGAFAPKGAGMAAGGAADNPQLAAAEAQTKILEAQTKAKELAVRIAEAQDEAQQRAADRQSKLDLEKMRFQHDHISDMMDIQKEHVASQGKAQIAQMHAVAKANAPKPEPKK